MSSTISRDVDPVGAAAGAAPGAATSAATGAASGTASGAPPEASASGAAPMSHRQVLEGLSGLLLGMLVAILSSTVVSTSLPKIIGDLGGGQSAFTWVVTATLLATTVSTPIWGKFADLFNRKLLLQTSLFVF